MNNKKEILIDNYRNEISRNNSLLDICILGETEAVKSLLEQGEYNNNILCYAVQIASNHNYLDLVKLLVEKGADNNDYSLISASEKGYLEIVEFLLDNGADIHANDDEALHLAYKNNHTEIIKLLLSRGANKKVIENSFCIIS